MGQFSFAPSSRVVSIDLKGDAWHGLEIRNRHEKNLQSSGYTVRFASLSVDTALVETVIDYSYDSLSRLVEADYNNGTTVYNYGYDVTGNMVNYDGVARTYNAANQMTNDGTNTLTYDNNGNLRTVGSDTYTCVLSRDIGCRTVPKTSPHLLYTHNSCDQSTYLGTIYLSETINKRITNMSEIKWIMKRAELRELLQDEDKQHWSDSALARCLKMSRDFVAKWRQPAMNTDLDDIESLKSRSRARLKSNKLVGEAVEAKILYYREILTEERNRRVGARGIKPFLLKDADLKQLKVYIPKSNSTINDVLNKYGRIPKPAPNVHVPMERPDAMQVWEIDFTDVPGAYSEGHTKKHIKLRFST